MTFLKRELTVTFSKEDGTVSNVTVSRSTENLLDEGWPSSAKFVANKLSHLGRTGAVISRT